MKDSEEEMWEYKTSLEDTNIIGPFSLIQMRAWWGQVGWRRLVPLHQLTGFSRAGIFSRRFSCLLEEDLRRRFYAQQ